MIDRIIELSIRHRGLVIVAGLALAIWGAYAVTQTPMDAVPDLSENQVIVFTDWPGPGPREVEDQITFPLSRRLQSLAELRVVRGSSDVNFSMIHLIFEDAADFATARTRVQERLAGLGDLLPAGVAPRMAPDAIPTGQIFWYTVEGKGYDLARLRAVQDWYVRPQLGAVAGVAEVASVGGQVLEYHVDLDPFLLRDRRVEAGDVSRELARSNAAVGGDVVHKGNAEFIVRGVGWLGTRADDSSEPDPQRVLHDMESVLIPTADGSPVPLREIARIKLGARPRRGILEKDGNEVTGGVVLIRYGHNPLEVTRRIKQKIQELSAGFPAGVRIVPCYDRTPLIEGAVRTVTGTLVEAILTATVCVVLVLLHWRTSFIIAVTLPLSALASFAAMWALRKLGIADIQTNIMSLAGIAISIGVLVDSSIVMAENVMFHLREKFGDKPVTGDIRPFVLPACLTVGRPIFFSVLIMLVSFLPVFALGGIDGRMYRPLAFTKSFALLAVALLAVTLVPALCTIFIKGRLRCETESWIVRSVVDVYRPILNHLLDKPGALVWLLGLTFVLGMAPLGSHPLLRAMLFAAMVLAGWTLRTPLTRTAGMVSLVIVALAAEQFVQPIQAELRMPLDEGMVMDMPITIPRASSVQSGDDLKARDMLLCRFPEVEMVVGKAGRADSAFDPAPLDMIETMVMFRPREFWPRRKLRAADAERHGGDMLDAMIAAGVIKQPADPLATRELVDQALVAAQTRFDAVMREFSYQRNQEFLRKLRGELTRFLVEETASMLDAQRALLRPATTGEIALITSGVAAHASDHLAMALPLGDVTRIAEHVAQSLAEQKLLRDESAALHAHPGLFARLPAAIAGFLGRTPPSFFTRLQESGLNHSRDLWAGHVRQLDDDLLDRAPGAYTRLVGEEILKLAEVTDPCIGEIQKQIAQARRPRPPATAGKADQSGHHGSGTHGPLPMIDPHPVLDKLHADLSQQFASRLVLRQCERDELSGSYGGEMDNVMQMPGWTNVWTMPIQNRVDMLATGINTQVGVRVLGPKLDDVVNVSEQIAAVLRTLPGAADVIADPIRGKGYLEIRPNREQAARHGVTVSDIHDVIETALGGTVATTTVEGRERHPVRVRYLRDWSRDEETVRRLPVPARQGPGETTYVPLKQVAAVQIIEGPATIKSENGLLRNYVRMNVRGQSPLDFVEEARRIVAQQVPLSAGTYIEWTGQFEHARETRKNLALLVPMVVGLIFLILYLTYRDLADACLMLLAVPGAVAGGILFQWLIGYKFSMAVGVGYIACFGMAAATGMIMLVYLREAVEKGGGLQQISLAQLRQAVLDGAVHRLRPKLLTEATTVLGLAPMLWASGVGAEVIRPMAAPVLGGILIADEVIDLLLPMLFYHVRRRRWLRLQSSNPPMDGPG